MPIAEPEEEKARVSRQTTKLGWILLLASSGSVALLGKGGFSNTDDPIANAVERFIFSAIPFAPLSFFVAYLVMSVVSQRTPKQ